MACKGLYPFKSIVCEVCFRRGTGFRDSGCSLYHRPQPGAAGHHLVALSLDFQLCTVPACVCARRPEEEVLPLSTVSH